AGPQAALAGLRSEVIIPYIAPNTASAATAMRIGLTDRHRDGVAGGGCFVSVVIGSGTYRCFWAGHEQQNVGRTFRRKPGRHHG
ncbi:MAG: hypothetical protein WBL84_07070, partial [Xanthobacteraceae bacterium]